MDIDETSTLWLVGEVKVCPPVWYEIHTLKALYFAYTDTLFPRPWLEYCFSFSSFFFFFISPSINMSLFLAVSHSLILFLASFSFKHYLYTVILQYKSYSATDLKLKYASPLTGEPASWQNTSSHRWAGVRSQLWTVTSVTGVDYCTRWRGTEWLPSTAASPSARTPETSISIRLGVHIHLCQVRYSYLPLPSN